jgi:hypothetical protein
MSSNLSSDEAAESNLLCEVWRGALKRVSRVFYASLSESSRYLAIDMDASQIIAQYFAYQ